MGRMKQKSFKTPKNEEPDIPEEYVSSSSIDNPPKEEAEVDEDGQVEIPGVEKEKPARQSRRVKFKLVLTLEDGSIKIAEGECPADMVEESLGKGLNSERARLILRSFVGEPLNLRLCEQSLTSAREESLATVVQNYASGLSGLKWSLPENPEGQQHDYVCKQIREALAKLEQLRATAERQLQTTYDEELIEVDRAAVGAAPGTDEDGL